MDNFIDKGFDRERRLRFQKTKEKLRLCQRVDQFDDLVGLQSEHVSAYVTVLRLKYLPLPYFHNTFTLYLKVKLLFSQPHQQYLFI